MMLRRLGVFLFAIACLGLVFGACNRMSEDWSDPEWVAYRMSLGDQRAFSEYSRLSSEERKSIVPSMIETYNDGMRQDRVLSALVEAEDPRAREVFLSALRHSNDERSARAASGLAAIGDEASASAIAERLTSVSTPSAYRRYFEALEKLPAPQIAEVVSGILLRPAPRIGGVSTVRAGCRMLAQVDDVTSEVAAAMTFSLVNMIPQPMDDPLNACELAILSVGEDMVPALLEMLNGENSRINDHVRTLDFQPVAAQARAALVLSRMRSDAAVEAVTSWLTTDHPVPVSEMEDLSIEEQGQWYATFGQTFERAIVPLYLRANEDDVELLRSLEMVDEDAALANFAQWLQLSQGAEIGFRQAVIDGLIRIGGDENVELVRNRATEGATSVHASAGESAASDLRRGALHFLGRRAEAGQLDAFDEIVAAQPEARQLHFMPLRAYWLVAEHCDGEVACLAGMIRDQDPIYEDEVIAEVLEGLEEEDEASMRRGLERNAAHGALWQLALLHEGDPEAFDVLVDRASASDLRLRLQVLDALIFRGELPADAAEQIAATIDEERDVRGVRHMREARHEMRILLKVTGH